MKTVFYNVVQYNLQVYLSYPEDNDKNSLYLSFFKHDFTYNINMFSHNRNRVCDTI